MFNIFWKSTFTLFLTILLVVNISYAFNIHLFIQNPNIDMTNSYFGISSIINFIQTRSIDNSFLGNYKNFCDTFYNFIVKNISGTALAQTDFSSFWGWLEFIGNLLLYIVSPIMFVVNAVLYFVYVLFVILYILTQLMLLFDNKFSYQMPTYTYNLPLITTPVM